MTEFEGFLVTLFFMLICFFILFAVAEIVEWGTERSIRRGEPRPKIPEEERRLLGDDWRDRAGRWSR